MKSALINADGVLLSYGFADFKPGPGQALLQVDDEFNLAIGSTKWDGKMWIDYVPPVSPRTLSDGELAAVLVKKGLLTPAEVISSG